jgi:predicted Zn-dependent peptidase
MNSHIAKGVIFGLIMTITTSASLAAHPELAKLGQIKFSAPAASRYTLDNGLVIYAVKDNTLPVVHISALIHTGSSRDPKGKAGLAQMAVELLRDGGTAGYPAEEMDKTLEYLGASLEVSAYTEESAAEMTVLRKDLDKVLDIFSDVLRNPVFEEEKIKIARDESLEIIRRRNDSPSKAAVREARRMFFGQDHPYGRRSEESTVNAVSKADLAAFHSAYFKPNNIILAVSGDFSSEEEIVAKIKEKFGSWQRGEIPPFALPQSAYSGGRKVYHIEKETPQAFIVVMHKGIGRTDPKNHTLSVLTDILGGGFQSRLFTEVRSKKGLAYDVGSGNANFTNDGFLISTCGTKPETYSQALSEILRQLGLTGEEAVSRDELDRSKASIINPFVFKFSTPHRLAMQRATEEFHSFPKDYLDNYVESVSRVDAAKVQAAGKKFTNPDNALILIIGNSKKFDRPLSEFGPVTELKED